MPVRASCLIFLGSDSDWFQKYRVAAVSAVDVCCAGDIDLRHLARFTQRAYSMKRYGYPAFC